MCFVCFFFGLGLFLVSSYKKKKKKKKKCDACFPSRTVCPCFACPGVPFCQGVQSKGSVPSIKLPPVGTFFFWTGQVEGITPRGLPVVKSCSQPPLLCLYCVRMSWLRLSTKSSRQPWECFGFHLRINGSLRWKMTVKCDWWSDDGNRQISVNMSRQTGVEGVYADWRGRNERRLWLNLALLTYLASSLNSYYFKSPITAPFHTFKAVAILNKRRLRRV